MTNESTRTEEALGILRANDRGGYTVPTAGLYPFQWNWDSAFAALGFAAVDMDRAWRELETLFSAQWKNGMVPHIIFHQDDDGYFPGPEVWQTDQIVPTSGISQPPVAATFARLIHRRDPALGKYRLAALYPKLLNWHRWFMLHRLDDGVISVTHPWESGRDNAPDWDEAMAVIDTSKVGSYTRRDTSHIDSDMRPRKEDYDRYLAILYAGRATGWNETSIAESGLFRVADPGMTFILLRANRDLAALAMELGHDTSEIDGWIRTLEAGSANLWNDDLGAYDARNVRTGRFAGSLSSASLLCWYGGLNDDRMAAPLERVWSATPFGLASHDPASPRFDGLRYWRGPIWGVVNMLIAMGLSSAGKAEQERLLREQTARLITEGGFHEYFDPRDGKPAGGGAFTWTAAIWLVWASGYDGLGPEGVFI